MLILRHEDRNKRCFVPDKAVFYPIPAVAMRLFGYQINLQPRNYIFHCKWFKQALGRYPGALRNRYWRGAHGGDPFPGHWFVQLPEGFVTSHKLRGYQYCGTNFKIHF